MNKNTAIISLSFFLSISSMMNSPAIMATSPDTKILLSILYVTSIIYLILSIIGTTFGWAYEKYSHADEAHTIIGKNGTSEPKKAIHALMLLSEQYQSEKDPVVGETILTLVEDELQGVNHEEPKPKCCSFIKKMLQKEPDNILHTDPFVVYRQLRSEKEKQRIWDMYLKQE